MLQSRGSNSEGLHRSVAGKILLRKLIQSKTFYIFTFSFKIQKKILGLSNFLWSLKHEIFFHSTAARFWKMNQVWVLSISKLLFQLFHTQKVRNQSRTENDKAKKGSWLESMLPSMTLLLQKKNLGQRADQSIKVSWEGFVPCTKQS